MSDDTGNALILTAAILIIITIWAAADWYGSARP